MEDQPATCEISDGTVSRERQREHTAQDICQQLRFPAAPQQRVESARRVREIDECAAKRRHFVFQGFEETGTYSAVDQ